MSKKQLCITGLSIFLLVLFISVAIWYWKGKEQMIVDGDNQSENLQAVDQSNTNFVVDVDPDINHWQTKETEFFTIKFPKEWYWLESKHEKNEGYSRVITNNPNFDMSKYSDIGIDAGMHYPLTLTNNTEIVITMSGVAGTTEHDTPLESVDWQLKRVSTLMNSDATCSRNKDSVPYPTAFCSYTENESQSVQVYFVAEKSITYAFTARTTMASGMDIRPVLERIAKSYMVHYAQKE